MSDSMRLFLQSQSTPRAVPVRAHEHLPSGGLLMSPHFVARSGDVVLKPKSNQQLRFYDPSIHGQAAFAMQVPKQVVVEDKKEVIEVEEENLNGFVVAPKITKDSPFAELGIVFEDDSEEADEEVDADAQDNEVSGVELDGDTVYTELLGKSSKSFGISKDELAALHLTKKQVKDVFNDVIGRTTNSTSIGKMKKRIRETANASYGNYTRVMEAIKKAKE